MALYWVISVDVLIQFTIATNYALTQIFIINIFHSTNSKGHHYPFDIQILKQPHLILMLMLPQCRIIAIFTNTRVNFHHVSILAFCAFCLVSAALHTIVICTCCKKTSTKCLHFWQIVNNCNFITADFD